MAIFRLLLSAFLILAYTSVGAKTTIKAFAPDYKNGKVMLYKYQDYLTEKRQFLNYATVDENGHFTLEVELKETGILIMVIDYVVCELLAAPDKRYSIFIPPLDKGDLRSYGETASVAPVFDNPSPNDVNVIISNLNFAVDSFMLANVELIGSRNFKTKYLEFSGKIEKKIEVLTDTYAKIHLTYNLAEYEFSASIYTPKELHQRYLSGDVHWNHPTYIGFVKNFFQRYFEVFESKYGTGKIVAAIHNANSGENLLQLLAQDEFLKNDTLLQLVAIHGLIEAKSGMYVRKNLIECFQYLESNGKTAFIQLMASNGLSLLTNIAKGFPAYNFGLTDQHNEVVALSDLKGKYVYLEIMAPWCSECKTEQSLIPAVAAEYKDIMQVVTIVTESDAAQYRKMLSQNPQITWTVLHDDTGHEIRQAFEISSLPTYFLIDPEGNFYRAPAKTPSQGIVEDLYPIVQKLKESNRPKVGEK
jgi:thiol-disulfide isomerase/thioredoxin